MPDTFNYLEITTLDGDRPRGSLHLRRFRSQFIVTARDHTDVAVFHLSYPQAEQLAEWLRLSLFDADWKTLLKEDANGSDPQEHGER